ncbi:MAG: ABC transporter permease subunit [Clostridiaceae bacterium]
MSGNKRWTKGIFLLLLPVLTFFLLLFIFPFIYGVYLSVTNGSGQFTFDNYIKFFTDPWESRTIWITLKISLPVTLLSVIAAIPFAYYMRGGIKGEKIITFFLIIPTSLGMVLLAEGMLTFMGLKGWVNQLLMAIGLTKTPIQFTHNTLGVTISLFLQSFPFAFLMLLGYISGINPDLEKAAKMLGASKMQTFWRIMFPLMVPGITIAFCLNFVTAFSVYPSAVLLGQPSGPTRVIAYAAYQWTYEKYNANMGSTICMVMAVVEIAVIAVVLLWRQKMYKGASMVGGKG